MTTEEKYRDAIFQISTLGEVIVYRVSDLLDGLYPESTHEGCDECDLFICDCSNEVQHVRRIRNAINTWNDYHQ